MAERSLNRRQSSKESTNQPTSRVSKSYVPFTCKFTMVMHFVPNRILHRRCRSKTNFYYFNYDKTSLKFCASFRFFLAVFMAKLKKIPYLNYVRRGIHGQFKRGSRGGTGGPDPPPPLEICLRYGLV